MQIDNTDPLSDLLLDVVEVNRARLASALRDVLGVDVQSGDFVPKPGYQRLSTRLKVLAYLLGRKAAVLLGKKDVETVAPKVISEDTGMPSGTVNPKLRELLSDHLVSQADTGEYYIAIHQLHQAVNELEGRADD